MGLQMNDEEIKSEGEAQAEAQASVGKSAAPKKRGPGRPPKSAMTSATPRRRGRPPKAASAAGGGAKRRGRPPKAMSLVVEFEREIEARFQTKLDKAEKQVADLKAELKAAQKRERAALKLFEKQEKALTKFVTTWNTKELAKVQKAAEPKRRRGRPRKNA
jgi:flagellar motility protein MotE (MotC chaperone)